MALRAGLSGDAAAVGPLPRSFSPVCQALPKTRPADSISAPDTAPVCPQPPTDGLYSPDTEHDNCGFGFICQIQGRPSHGLIDRSLEMLENMEHRGGCGCDPDSGDGAGLLIGMPDAFLRRVTAELRFQLPRQGEYAVATLFLPQDVVDRRKCERLLERVVADYDMEILGWRDVPTDNSMLGTASKKAEPRIRQAFVGMKQQFFNRSDFNRRLYLVRQRVENTIEHGPVADWSPRIKSAFYICSISTNRLIYKGMLTAPQLSRYFADLRDPEFASHFAIVHSRFSTNTFPSWRLAHPYRYLAHNGEINTIRGNRNWMKARYSSLRSERFGDELEKLYPILSDATSDSATLDNCLQFLTVNGRPLAQAMLMLIPEAWHSDERMDPDLKAFYEYHACLMEPWDGPAGVTFTDGRQIGAILDRNGLRPARYYVTTDDHVIMGSEAGVIDLPPEEVKQKWRLQPGKMLLIDFEKGRFIDDAEIKQQMLESRPWRRWLNDNMVVLDDVESEPLASVESELPLLKRQRAFGYTTEDVRLLISPMAATAYEATGSMGTDTPLACLSTRPQPLFNYFKQLFAQVTNPPLDAIREELVTSLVTYLGHEQNLLAETPEHARMIKLAGPMLTSEQLAKLRRIGDTHPHFRSKTISMCFELGSDTAAEPGQALERALDELCHHVSEAVHQGVSIIILSDRDVGETRVAIPSMLAMAAVHHHLIRDGTRNEAGIVLETADAREGHHFCCLLGYGAGAINPYLALDTVQDLHAEGRLPGSVSADQARDNFIKASHKAILKIASKMGISTVQSYRGAQIFECLGIGREVIDRYFTGTASRIGGVGLDVLEAEAFARHHEAFPPMEVEHAEILGTGGNYQWRRDGEHHQWNPDTVVKLQKAVRVNSFETFQQFSALVDEESKQRSTLRGLLRFANVAESVPLDEVEPAREIVKRFATGAMSYGSISKEAHETLAIAMNEIGGRSNTGEGGEDPERLVPLSVNGKASHNPRRSSIKQVASGRFGVTVEYLTSADQIQIKVAQGAKPGEGGALAGAKVDQVIGKLRYSTPGVGLISPPPHHDIYSIEDLAQLIHDLKNVNPSAEISVKLVSEVGVGTIAAGVAKAKADHIVISGDSGGTGNAALSSIKHCGLPWELGLAETQQVLLANGLRGRVKVQADGGMRTGRDVIVAALLGAEEVGFSTAPLIAIGCIMMRVCHLNTCPVGVATQDPELRKKFVGQPEHVINYMFCVAEEVRQYMAELGFRSFDEMVGRSDCLMPGDIETHPKGQYLDLQAVLKQIKPQKHDSPRQTGEQDHDLDRALDNRLIELARPAIDRGERVVEEVGVRNINRTCGAMLSGEVVKRHGQTGLPDGSIHFKLAGTAGQSFGAFLAAGVTLELEGDANDYLGKGLSGGRVVVYPHPQSPFKAEENLIAGNVIAYGAIAGEIYLRGIVGERFCVRNSGASAVVEGVGDHGCEYMTGGRVAVLGPVGRNFAAGMSGGVAYVYDPSETFETQCNHELVEVGPVDEDTDQNALRQMLESHARWTASTVAAGMLEHFDSAVKFFKRVMPREYKRIIEQQKTKQPEAAVHG